MGIVLFVLGLCGVVTAPLWVSLLPGILPLVFVCLFYIGYTVFGIISHIYYTK